MKCELKKIRADLGLSQAQMARDIEMSVKDLWQIENGRNVTISTAAIIYKYLRSTLPELSITDIWPLEPEPEAA